MPRTSAFRGTFQPNRRPYVVITADAYVSLQGQTSVIACGECRREVNLNKYLTGISVDTSVDSPPGSATVTLSVPDNDINDFYSDNELIIIPMMEIELFAKGYFTVGGFPQYYRIFWGLVSSVTKNWSNGVTTITLNCKDILRWWELTNVITQSAFLEAAQSQSGWNLMQNKFAGANPYTVIITLAKEAMGDFSLTTGSFTSFRPEYGPEQKVIAQYAKDIMAYWQLKFGNIWNSLVLYGTSGQAYTFAGDPGNVSPVKIAREIFEAEDKSLSLNPETALFKIQPHEVAAVKVDISRAADVDLFQNETQTKLQMALTARDQAGAYEFYCDTTGDIVFKPPFYNLNVMPNKPVSWIQDFEIIDDSITESEAEVFTHVTSSGNAFGGVTDWGLNDDITTPRTGVIDWHLLRRYGWRHMSIQIEWAGNPKKLFYFLLDYIDKINTKRSYGSVTIPMRPELRMGFPVWIPKYDSFYYVNAISHNYSPGGQATTALQLTAKRSKFVAPKNVGRIETTGSRTTDYKDPVTKKKTTFTQDTYSISFPSDVGATAGLNVTGQEEEYGGPAILRDPKTGKLLGFPNAVMVYRSTLSGRRLAEILQKSGSKKGNKPQKQDQKKTEGPNFTYAQTTGSVLVSLQNEKRAEIIDRLRLHRYEAGMNNAGAYDYAHDSSGKFKEFSVIPTSSIQWGTGTIDPDAGILTDTGQTAGAQTVESKAEQKKIIDEQVKALEAQLPGLQTAFNNTNKLVTKTEKEYQQFKKSKGNPKDNELDEETKQRKEVLDQLKARRDKARQDLEDLKKQIKDTKANRGRIQALTSLNVMVRPVSDEFGFEVVGHHRYGRGAFIDRGQLQIPDPNSVLENPKTINQLNIQFAPHGGLLTDPSLQNSNNLGPESTNFADLFEKMQPDDYMTGATFKGANYSDNSQLEDVNPTNQNTYTSSLRNSSLNGSAVFAEADALRRAVTLAELKPTSSNGLDDAFSEKCGCQLGRTDWLSVLPESFIRQVLSPIGSTTIASDYSVDGVTEWIDVDGQDEVLPPDGTVGPNGDVVYAGGIFYSADGNILEGLTKQDDGSIVASTGEVVFSPNKTTIPTGTQFSIDGEGGFFDVLRQFLVQKFNADYVENKTREQFAINGGMERFAPNLEEQDNILPTPDNTLFDRASQGDPDALESLAQGANFNFGRSEEALSTFKDKVSTAAEQAEKDFTNHLSDIPGSLYSAATGGLVKITSDGSTSSGVTVSSDPPPQWQPPTNPVYLPAIANPTAFPSLGSGLAATDQEFQENIDESPTGEGTPPPDGVVPSED